MTIKKLVCIGDSITYGYGVPKGFSWFDLLCAKLPFPMINRGRNGAGLADLLFSFKEDVLHYSPSHVMIFAGLNEIITGFEAKRLFPKAIKLIELSKENKIEPLLATLITPRPHVATTGWIYGHDYEDIKKEVHDFNSFLKDEARKENLLLLDFDELFKNKHQDRELFPDGIHPNTKGHAIMENYMRTHLGLED